MFSIDAVKSALSHVNDPDLGKDLVSLNMIEDIKIEEGKISFVLVLTTPACPLKEKMKKDCIEAIALYIGPDIQTEIRFSSKVQAARIQNEDLLKEVKNILLVGSGKGGVGKSTVAANIAVSLAKQGAKVALVDADIYGPSVPILFGLQNQKPLVEEKNGSMKILPIEKFGIKIISIGFFVEAEKAVLWRGPMASNALKQMFTDTSWGEIDYMVVDMPPGTGDIQISLSQMFPVSGAVLVSTPQALSVADVRKAADMFCVPNVNIPIFGIIENMAYFTPAEYPDHKYYIFGKGGAQALAADIKVPFLGQIPLVQALSESGDSGFPAASTENILSVLFDDLASKIAQAIAIRNVMRPV